MAYSFLNNLCMKSNENSSWFSSNKFIYKKYLEIDLKIRHTLLKFSNEQYYIIKFSIEILQQNEQKTNKNILLLNIHTICAKRSRHIDAVYIKKDILRYLKHYKPILNINYINIYVQFSNTPMIYSEYIAKYLATEMRQRISQRKLVSIAESCIMNGALGCIIQIKGRVNGYGMSRKYNVIRGTISRNTWKNNVEFFRYTYFGKSGTVGIKVFVNRIPEIE